MKFYALIGSSSDNAFTTYNGQPTRTFMAFEGKKEREDYRAKVWKDSNHETNLIDCTRKLVEKYEGRHYYIAPNKVVYSNYEEYEMELEYKKQAFL